jgi:hypothetical protein
VEACWHSSCKFITGIGQRLFTPHRLFEEKVKQNLMWKTGLPLLIITLSLSSVLSVPFSAQAQVNKSRFMELRVSSPINQAKYDSYIQQLVSGSIITTYNIEYQYPNSTLRVIGIDIKSTDNKIYKVHLAPSSLFIEKGIELHPNDKVMVVGTIMDVDQQPALIASAISKGEDRIKLRTAHGLPLWTLDTELGRGQITKLLNYP